MPPILRKIGLTELSVGQRLGWYFSSLIYGLCVVAVAGQSGAVAYAGATASLVFLGCWIAGVVLLRIYLQDKDPTSFSSLLGLGSKKR